MMFRVKERGDSLKEWGAHKLINSTRQSLRDAAEEDDLWSFYLKVRSMADQIHSIDSISICRYFEDRKILAYVFLSDKGTTGSWLQGQTKQGSERPLGGATGIAIETRKTHQVGPMDSRDSTGPSETFGFDKRSSACLYLPVFSATREAPMAVLGVFSYTETSFDPFWIAIYEMLAKWVGLCLDHRETQFKMGEHASNAASRGAPPSDPIKELGLTELEMEILVWRASGATQELLRTQLGLPGGPMSKDKFYTNHKSAFEKIQLATKAPDTYVRRQLTKLGLPLTIEEVHLYYRPPIISLDPTP